MIDKKHQPINSLKSLLNCGYLDIEFLLNLADTIDNKQFIINGEEKFIYSIDDEGLIIINAIEQIRENNGQKTNIEINTLIYYILDGLIRRIQEHYKIELEEGKDYEIYTNFLDSHLYLLNEKLEGIKTLDGELLTDQQIKEINDIITNFN